MHILPILIIGGGIAGTSLSEREAHYWQHVERRLVKRISALRDVELAGG